MDATFIISMLAFGLSFATFIVIRLNRQPGDDLSDQIAHGDTIKLPSGFHSKGNNL